MNTFWEVLGISPTDNKKEIRAAYAAKSRLYHPEDEPEEFAELNNAYKAALNYISGNPSKTSDMNFGTLADTIKTFDKNAGTLTVQKEKPQDVLKDSQQSAEAIKGAEINGTKILDAEETDSEEKNGAASLLSRLQDFEEQEIRESLEKLKESKEKGALKKFISIFEQAKENGKFPRADVWKEFFLSEEFLCEQYSYVFANGMMNYLSDWSMEGNYNVFQLPDSFLVELAIAFALMPEQDYRDTNGRMVYHVNDTGFPARETAAYLWNNQQREYLPVRILYKNENLVRLRSFSDYVRLRKLNSQNALTEDNKHVWRDLLTGGCVNHIYELNGKGQHNIYEHTRSITLIKLCTFWIQNDTVPDCILEYMYKEYDLKSIEHSSREKLYAPLKQAILTKSPAIEDTLFGDESIKQMLSSWYRAFTKIIKEKETDFHKGIYEDSETIKNHVKQLFEDGTWAKIKHSKELLEKLHLQLIGREALPKSLASHLIEFYGGFESQAHCLQRAYNCSNDLSDDGDTVCRMLHNILETLGFERKVMENNGSLLVIKETASIHGISNDNIEFWSYYLMTGFGFRNVEESCLNGAYCCLPYYMKCMYYPSLSWRKLFTGVGETTPSQPVATEFTLPDGKKLKTEFHLHYCLYFLDDKPVYSTEYTLEQCLEFSKHIEKTEHKFFLLAITSINEEEQDQAVKIIEKWLSELKLYSFTIHTIACMLASDNAGILQDISANSSETDIGEDDIKAVYYKENERFCFRAVVTTEAIILFYKSDFGWLLYEERVKNQFFTPKVCAHTPKLEMHKKRVQMGKNIEKEKTINILEQRQLSAKSALESLRQPAPVTICSFPLDGMDNNQKAEKIIEALIYYGKFRNQKDSQHLTTSSGTLAQNHSQVPNETCYPWKKEFISAPIKKFLENMGSFMTESYCVLSYGKEKKRKEVFYFAIRPFESKNGHGIIHTDSNQMRDLDRKIKKEHFIAGSFGLSNSCDLERDFKLKTFAIGLDGTYYVYDIFHMHKSENLTELIAKTYDFSHVTQVDVYEGLLSISRLDGNFEYCYGEEDFKESAYSMELTTADKFTRFTRGKMMLELACWLDNILNQDMSEYGVLCFELHKDNKNMYSLNLYSQSKEFYNYYHDATDYDDDYSGIEAKRYIDKYCTNILNGNKKLAWKIWGGERQYIKLTDEFEEILLWYMDYGKLGKKLKNCLRIDIIWQDDVKSIVNTDGILNALRERTAKKAYLLEVHPDKPSDIFDSKFGGMPYWVPDREYPTDSSGKKLLLIAQINLDKSPVKEFNLCSGMLQFFGDSEEIFKEDFGGREDMDKYRVIYHETIDYTISRDELESLGVPDSTSSEYQRCIMTSKELAMDVTQKTIYIGIGDYRFDMELRNAIKDRFGFDIGDMTYQDIFEERSDIVDEFGTPGNWLLGYPDDLEFYPEYPRNDPRDTNKDLRQYDQLLFQFDVHYLDHDYNDYFYDHGGCGIAGFYIRRDDLEKKNFGHILYHWGACEQ